MKKEQHKIISDTISTLIGKKLHTVLRAGSMANFGFGDLIECEFPKQNEDGDITMQKATVPRFALHVDCFFRLSCVDEILLSRGDIFEPSEKLSQQEGFDYNSFDWSSSYGNNRFEENAGRFFSGEPIDFIVKHIAVSKLGDLKISFENGFILEVMPDISGNEECWRFFEITADSRHLTVTGQGIEYLE